MGLPGHPSSPTLAKWIALALALVFYFFCLFKIVSRRFRENPMRFGEAVTDTKAAFKRCLLDSKSRTPDCMRPRFNLLRRTMFTNMIPATAWPQMTPSLGSLPGSPSPFLLPSTPISSRVVDILNFQQDNERKGLAQGKHLPALFLPGREFQRFLFT